MLLAVSVWGIAGIPLLAGVGAYLLVGSHIALAAGLTLHWRPSRLKIAAAILAMIWWPITALLIIGALLPAAAWMAWSWRQRRTSRAQGSQIWPSLPADAGARAALIGSSLALAAVAGWIARGWIS